MSYCYVCTAAGKTAGRASGAGNVLAAAGLIVCSECGDTRCARAFNHADVCTGPMLPIRSAVQPAAQIGGAS